MLLSPCPFFSLFFFNATATTEIYTLSLHDALPIYRRLGVLGQRQLLVGPFAHDPRQLLPERFVDFLEHLARGGAGARQFRSEEHTSELQSQSNLVCRLLLEKKKKKTYKKSHKTSIK